METNNFKHIIIQKNRGWRGLAEARVLDQDNNVVLSMMFSFSQKVWDDMLDGYIVLQDADNYYIIKFDEFAPGLPRKDQQRSVLIKYFEAYIRNVAVYPKKEWNFATGKNWTLIEHERKNNNHHTQSDWNYIGVRVMPEI